MKVKEEILDQLEQMLYNYVEGHVDESERELKEIFKFCVDNQPKKKPTLTEGATRFSVKSDSKRPSGKPPAPKAKGFKPGDLVFSTALQGEEEFVYLYGDSENSYLFSLSGKEVRWCRTKFVAPAKPKPKQVVLSAPELIKVLEEDGYYFVDRGKTSGWVSDNGGWGFDCKMFAYCGKEPDPRFIWNPRWLK